MLAYTRMKEKQLWSFLLREWDVSFGMVLLRTLWLALVGWAVIGMVSLVGGCDDPRDRDPSGLHTQTVK